jgi:hypothetical protein
MFNMSILEIVGEESQYLKSSRAFKTVLKGISFASVAVPFSKFYDDQGFRARQYAAKE